MYFTGNYEGYGIVFIGNSYIQIGKIGLSPLPTKRM